MANFDAATKRTSAVFLKQQCDGKTVYIREPYNLVCYNFASGTNEISGIEGQSNVLFAQQGASAAIDPREIYDEVMIIGRPWAGGITRLGNN